MEKLTGNEPAYPTGDKPGLTILQVLASRQMAAYRSSPTLHPLPSNEVAVYAVNDAIALIKAFNLGPIEPGAQGLLKAIDILDQSKL